MQGQQCGAFQELDQGGRKYHTTQGVDPRLFPTPKLVRGNDMRQCGRDFAAAEKDWVYCVQQSWYYIVKQACENKKCSGQKNFRTLVGRRRVYPVQRARHGTRLLVKLGDLVFYSLNTKKRMNMASHDARSRPRRWLRITSLSSPSCSSMQLSFSKLSWSMSYIYVVP